MGKQLKSTLNNCNSRIITIDILRGLATIAVILGHAVQRGMITGYSDTLIWKVIYAWHMPMFFFLAGITLYLGIPSKEKITLGLIWIKFKRLIIPTFVWNIIIYLMKDLWFVGIQPFITFPDNLVDYLVKLVYLPTYVIWFLYVLFVYTMIVFLVKKFIKERYQILFILLLFPILYIFRTGIFGLSYIGNYYIYFTAGYLFSNYNLLKKYNLLAKISVGFVICVFFMVCIPNFMNINIIIKVAGLLKTIFIALAIILIMWICVEKTINAVPKVIKGTLMFFGKNSLQFYLCQGVCLNIGIGSGGVRIISIFIITTVIACFLVLLTLKFKFTRAVLYGSF